MTNSFRILGVDVHLLDLSAFLTAVDGFVASKRPHQIITANALMLLSARNVPVLADAFRAADLVVPDSAGVALVARLRGRPLPARLPGVELIDHLCALAAVRRWNVFLLGAAPGVAGEAGRRLAARHPGLRIAGTRDGYFSDEDEVFREIAAAKPDLLFVALSVPRQDAWIHANLGRLGAPATMGVGGSFDVISGRLRRAPRWMAAAGLEWLFRLAQEPRRIGRIARLPSFFWKVFWYDVRGGQPD